MKVFIVRHGQVPHNASRTYCNEDEDLTVLGVEQANTLKNKMHNLDYDVIFSSPLTRAIHTAEIINVKNKGVIIDDRLKERSPGDLSGKPLRSKEYASVLIVAHSGVSKAFSAYFQGINDGKFLEHGLKNCEIKKYNL